MKRFVEFNKRNKEFDQSVPQVTKSIWLFYHIYCGSNDWRGIVHEQVSVMKMSDLWSRLEKIYLCIIGDDTQTQVALSFFKDVDCEVVHNDIDGTCYEFPLLEKMKSLSQTNDFYALYCHTKGASYSRMLSCEEVSFDWKQLQLSHWRMLMNYYCLYKWNIAINALEAEYTTYGILERENPKKHYSGNFWWADSSVAKNACHIDAEFKKDRYNAEFWILESPMAHSYAPFKRGLLLKVERRGECLRLLPWYHIKNLMYLLDGFLLK